MRARARWLPSHSRRWCPVASAPRRRSSRSFPQTATKSTASRTPRCFRTSALKSWAPEHRRPATDWLRCVPCRSLNSFVCPRCPCTLTTMKEDALVRWITRPYPCQLRAELSARNGGARRVTTFTARSAAGIPLRSSLRHWGANLLPTRNQTSSFVRVHTRALPAASIFDIPVAGPATVASLV